MKPFDQNGEFQLLLPGGTLARRAVRGAGATLFAQGGGIGVQLVATIVLARLLTPADFGVVTMVTTFSLLFVNFGLNGFTEAVIQYPKITHRLISNLFWVNLAFGALLTLIFAASGSLMARFYGNSHVAAVAGGIALTIFATSLSVMHLALMMRAMQFPRASLLEFLSRIVYVVVCVIFALAGWGYWALVAGAVAQPLSKAIGAWILCPWLPGLPRRTDGTASLVKFSMHVYGRFSLNYFSRNTDNLLVGWQFNAAALGFYKKAYDLFALTSVVQSLTNVAVSALSRVRDDSAQYRRYLLHAISVTAFLAMAMGAALTLAGRDLIRMLLGPGWDPAGRIFLFFGPGIATLPLYAIHSWIHLSIGTPNRWLRWAWVEFVFTVMLFALGLYWGPSGVAAAWSVSLCILTLPALWYAGAPIQFEIGPIIQVMWRYVVSSVLACGVTALLIAKFSSFAVGATSMQAAIRVATISILFAVLYLSFVLAFHRSWAPLRQVGVILREFMPGAKPQPSAKTDANVYALDAGAKLGTTSE